MSLAVGDPVNVLSRSEGRWHRDGVVVEVAAEAANVDGQDVPAGAVKVIYAGGESAKWVPPEAFGEEVRDADFEVGDKALVYVRSSDMWVADGIVQRVLAEAGEADGQQLPAGAVLVHYQSESSAKWVPPEFFREELRPRRDFVPEDAKQLAYFAPGAEPPAAAEAAAAMPVAPADDGAFIVSQATGGARAAAGRFTKAGVHNERAKYKNSSGAIIYFDNWWKLNTKDDVLQWCYEVRDATGDEPPAGTWGCTRFYRGGTHPPLEVGRASSAEVIRVAGAEGRSAVCNGPYLKDGEHNERTKFKNYSGAVIYFDGYWKMTVNNKLQTWHFFNRDTGVVPPSGQWAADPRVAGDATPVVVACSLAAEAA